jgi:hypothetical protein
MFSYQNFDDVFVFDPDCYYSEATIRSIEAHRKKLEGLFIERVMKLLGIKRRIVPPPLCRIVSALLTTNQPPNTILQNLMMTSKTFIRPLLRPLAQIITKSLSFTTYS